MSSDLFGYLVRAIVLLTAIPIHESAHAFAASKLGDNTAKSQGRISLNPAVHFDLMGSLCMIIAGIGWAKPVPINSYNFKGNRKVGMALSAAAGPASNLAIALVSIILAKVFLFSGGYDSSAMLLNTLYIIFITMAQINIMLAIFNLIPIPPFDGSRIFNLFLPESYYFKLMQYERYIFLGLFVVLITGILDVPLSFLTGLIFNFFNFITGFVDMIFGAIA